MIKWKLITFQYISHWFSKQISTVKILCSILYEGLDSITIANPYFANSLYCFPSAW